MGRILCGRWSELCSAFFSVFLLFSENIKSYGPMYLKHMIIKNCPIDTNLLQYCIGFCFKQFTVIKYYFLD